MDLQVCTCTTCIKHTITTPNGEAIPGSWVHPSTRRRHWAQNLTPQDNNHIPVSALPSIPPPDETSPASEPDSEPADTLSEVESIRSYQDSRTITKHLGLDPEIESSICCPKCFSLYEHEDAPTICAYHRSKKAQVCGEGLFKQMPINSYLDINLSHLSGNAIHLLSSHSPSLGVPHSALQFLAEMVSERAWH
ncbi:hypothetical protein KEM48_007505 [Puccinia striiformis f. sp. tritici PST-130]|nr:hypothetical protein KEM48_007505 [Puccinia striiformis f. sp. tritici PST-130]